jgi:hypothetical protein
MALSMAYLSAESHLLKQVPSGARGINPHLHKATQALRGHLRRIDWVGKRVEGVEKGVVGVFDYADFLGRGLLGIIRSRG